MKEVSMKNELEDFLRKNRMHLDNQTPDPAVLKRILEQMQAKQTSRRSEPKRILISFKPVRWAAACLILAACGILFRVLYKPSSKLAVRKAGISHRGETVSGKYASTATRSAGILKRKQATTAIPDTAEADLSLHKQAAVAQTKLNTLKLSKQVMYAGLSNMESPASRINAAYYSYKLNNTNNDVADALVEALNTDPSPNVRLAVLDGLARFYKDGYIRKKLVASLEKQQDPVVQITLINLLTGMREPGVIEELSKIVQDDNTMSAVKDCAYAGLFRLRSS